MWYAICSVMVPAVSWCSELKIVGLNRTNNWVIQRIEVQTTEVLLYVCMYVHVHLCMYVCMYVCTVNFTYNASCFYAFQSCKHFKWSALSAGMGLFYILGRCMNRKHYKWSWLCMYMYLCMYVCVCVCVCVSMHACMYVCMYV